MPVRPPLAYVMGPSGAGKDTLLRAARARLDGSEILFAHRYITRAPMPGDENFIALSEGEFLQRAARGLFAFHWAAHGVRYGIGREIEQWRDSGAVVVVSGSRAHFQNTFATADDVVPVLITAAPEILAARLASRGREDQAAIAQRIARTAAAPLDHPRLAIIDNSDTVEAACLRFAAVLSRLTETAPAL